MTKMPIHCHCQTKFMSEVDFDFAPFLEEITSTIGAATTDSVVFTASVQSLSTSLGMVFPSGGCLPQLLCALLGEVGCLSLSKSAIAVYFTGTGTLCILNIINHCRDAS